MSDKWSASKARANNLRLSGLVFGIAAAAAALLVIVRLADSESDTEIVDYFTGLGQTAVPFTIVAAVLWVGAALLEAVIPSSDED